MGPPQSAHGDFSVESGCVVVVLDGDESPLPVIVDPVVVDPVVDAVEPVDVVVPVPAPAVAVAAVPTPCRSRRGKKPRDKVPPPAKRTNEQHDNVCYKMRNAKLSKANNILKKKLLDVNATLVEKKRKAPVRGGGRAIRKRDVDKALDCLKTGNDKKRRRTMKERRLEKADRDLELAFSTSLRTSEVATKHGTDPTTVRCAFRATAKATLNRQLEILDEWVAECEKRDGDLFALCEQTGQDSVKSIVVMPAVVGEDQKMKSPVHILVVVKTLLLVFRSETIMLRLKVPVTPMVDTSSGTLYSCLYEAPWMRDLQSRITLIKASAQKYVGMFAQDGAYPNEKFFAGLEDMVKDPLARVLCFNHRVSLTEASLL